MSRFKLRKQTIEQEKTQRAFVARQKSVALLLQVRHGAAVKIQTYLRRYFATKYVANFRYAIALERAVRKVQLSWRRSRGNYALHIRFLAKRAFLDDLMEESSIVIQCMFRCFIARQIFDRRYETRLQQRQEEELRQTSSRKIQRTSNIWMARKERGRLHQKRFLAAARMQTLQRRRAAQREVQRRRELFRVDCMLRATSANTIQKIVRGNLARRKVILQRAALALEVQQQAASAEAIQKRYLEEKVSKVEL